MLKTSKFQDRKIALLFAACSIVPFFLLYVLTDQKQLKIRNCGTDKIQWAQAQALANRFIVLYLAVIVLSFVSGWTSAWIGFSVSPLWLVIVYTMNISMSALWVIKGIHWVPPVFFRDKYQS
jgi:hypothetical protein